MSMSFKQFTTLIAEGKKTYTSQTYWKGDAEAAGFTVKKLSGDATKGDQSWGAFNEADEKVGEFAEKEGGWLNADSVNEMFGIFKNNVKYDTTKLDKIKAEREKKKQDAAKAGKKPADGDDEEEEDDDEEAKRDPRKRSNSTKTTRPTTSAAGGRAAERDWVANS